MTVVVVLGGVFEAMYVSFEQLPAKIKEPVKKQVWAVTPVPVRTRYEALQVRLFGGADEREEDSPPPAVEDDAKPVGEEEVDALAAKAGGDEEM